MSCPCNCNCIVFDFGVFDCSECITLPIEATQAGEYQLKAEWRDKVWYIPAVLEIGELIEFRNIFNEDSTVTFQIINPNGSIFKYDLYCGDVLKESYTHFSVTIKQVFTLKLDTTTAQEICGSELDETEAKQIICTTF